MEYRCHGRTSRQILPLAMGKAAFAGAENVAHSGPADEGECKHG